MMEIDGREKAQRMNILAVRVVAETLKTTLGPKGMDKMLVSDAQVALTDSGSVILSMINIKHPAAKMLVKLAEAQNKEIGDGATSSVVLTGEFLKNAQELMDQGIHPTTIVKGFVMAYTKALEFLEKIAFDVHDKNLKSIAMTMLQGKVEEEDAEHLAEITVEAIKIAGKKENIKIEYRPGGKIKDTKLIKGMMIDLGKRVHPSMPKKVKNAKILLIDREFDVRKLENAKIEMNDPMRMKAFMDYKKKVLEVAVNMIARCGANVVLCEKNIAEVAMSYLAMKGILGVRDVPKDVLVLLQKSTGAKIVSNINDVSPSVLGYAGLVEETKIGMEEIMYITECKDPKSAGILIRGGTENVTMEIKRRLESLIGVLSSMINEKKAVAGGGATELEISMRLKEYARKVEGKEQLAIDAYASALEAIPKSLIINAGRNPIDLMPKIKSEHENGRLEIGFDVQDGKIKNVFERGIIEYIGSKKYILKASTEVANTILRIDEIFEIEKKPVRPKLAPPPEGMPSKEGKIDLAAARSLKPEG